MKNVYEKINTRDRIGGEAVSAILRKIEFLPSRLDYAVNFADLDPSHVPAHKSHLRIYKLTGNFSQSQLRRIGNMQYLFWP